LERGLQRGGVEINSSKCMLANIGEGVEKEKGGMQRRKKKESRESAGARGSISRRILPALRIQFPCTVPQGVLPALVFETIAEHRRNKQCMRCKRKLQHKGGFLAKITGKTPYANGFFPPLDFPIFEATTQPTVLPSNHKHKVANDSMSGSKRKSSRKAILASGKSSKGELPLSFVRLKSVLKFSSTL
jgi:hypothetical protein